MADVSCGLSGLVALGGGGSSWKPPSASPTILRALASAAKIPPTASSSLVSSKAPRPKVVLKFFGLDMQSGPLYGRAACTLRWLFWFAQDGKEALTTDLITPL